MCRTFPLFRQGIARNLLNACSEYADSISGMSGVQLHVRIGDEPAMRLYELDGYNVVKDGICVNLRGISPRALLEKRLYQLQSFISW